MRAFPPKSAVVTAGGTRESIDDVRKVTNISSGRFGIEIAKALAGRGLLVNLLVGHTAQLHTRGLNDPHIKVIGFDSFQDLADRIADTNLTSSTETPNDLPMWPGPPDLFFMAAAVSDYSPEKTTGKISSDQDELVIRMTRNPKLLSGLRELFGIRTFICGFKLLSGVPREELRRIALRQVHKCRINLCLANDLAQLADGNHPALMVTPEGGAIPLNGGKAEVAHDLVDFVLRRVPGEWFSSRTDDNLDKPLIQNLGLFLEAHPDAGDLLEFAQNTALLRDNSGNVSARAGDLIVVTPRQVDKPTLTRDQLIPVKVHCEKARFTVSPKEVRQRGHKPFIDTGVHGLLYRRLPEIDRLIHFHDGLMIPTTSTSFPYACGIESEADEICRSLADAAARGNYSGGSFLLELIHHGYLLGLDQKRYSIMVDSWRATRNDYIEHLEAVGEPSLVSYIRKGDPKLRLSPIFRGPYIIGVFAERLDRGYASCYLLDVCRNRGWGEELMDRLIARSCSIGTHKNCGVDSWYHRFGFKTIHYEDGLGHILDQADLAVMIPPILRTDLIPAATACVVNPISRQVLIGERLTKNWEGHFALPGGHIEKGETPLQTALRELREETGLELYDQTPRMVRRFYTGTQEGRVAFGVDCHLFLTVCSTKPKKTDELHAEWVPLDTAWCKRPMSHATRRMLKELLTKFPHQR